MSDEKPASPETLAGLLELSDRYSARVRRRAIALLNRANLELDGPALKVGAARTALPKLLDDARSRRPRVISSHNRSSVVLLSVDDLLSLVALTDPESKASSLGRLPASQRPTTSIEPRGDVDESLDDRALPDHAGLERAALASR